MVDEKFFVGSCFIAGMTSLKIRMQQSLLHFENDVFKVTSALAQTLYLTFTPLVPEITGSNNRPFLCRTL
jgi:hypothetical protein